MMNESIFKTSLTRFKKNSASYIAVGVLCGLFITLLSLLSFIDSMIFLLTIPFFVLPFIFASFIACYYLEVNQPINISYFFRYFFGYFRPQFRGSFRAIRAFLLSLAFYFGGVIISYFVFYAIYQNAFGATFSESMNELVRQYLSNEFTNEDLIRTLEANDGLLLTFFIYITSFSFIPAIIYFLSAILYASLSIYYRANVRSAVPSLISLAINNTYERYRRSIRKDWLKLNWPLYVLPLIGSVVGILIYFFAVRNINFLSAIIIISSIIPLMFFLPFYFSNMEVLYHRYENAFKEGNQMAVETILMRIQNSIELSEEERKNLEESFKSDNESEE